MKFDVQGTKLIKVTETTAKKPIIVPERITELDPDAFRRCAAVPYIRLSGNIRHIPDTCFEGVKALCIYLPNKLESIGRRAFAKCRFSSITLPDSIQEIGDEAFAGNESLEKIRWPLSLKKLGYHALKGCTSLKRIEADPSLLCRSTFYPLYSFFNGIESFVIPDGVTHLYMTAFQGCRQLRSLTIPNSVMHIGDLAFADCFAIQELVLPEQLTDLHPRAFYNCPSLLRITLSREAFLKLKLMNPSDLSATATVINVKKSWLSQKNSPLTGCRSLQKIYLYKDQKLIEEAKQAKAANKAQGIWEDASFVYKAAVNGTILLKCKKKAPRQLTIPAFVTSIDSDAFQECSSIQHLIFEEGFNHLNSSVFEKVKVSSLSIPCSLTDISGAGFHGFIYYNSLSRYSYFPALKIPENHPAFRNIDDTFILEKKPDGLRTVFYLPFNKPSDKVRIPDGTVFIGTGTFRHVECRSLIIPSSVREIEKDAFDNTLLTELFIEDGCKTLHDGWANSLSSYSLVLPGSIENIGYSPYFRPRSVRKVSCVKDSAAYHWIKKTFSSYISVCLINTDRKKKPDPAANDILSLFTIRNNYAIKYLGRTLTRIDLNELTHACPNISFKEALFCSHRELTEVVLPDGMQILPTAFFADCSNLTSVHIPSSMEVLDDFAFDRCDSLTRLVIPDHVKKISSNLFGSPYDVEYFRRFQIFGTPGSEAERFAAVLNCHFINIDDTSLTKLTDIFSWKKENDCIRITDVKNPENPEPLIIPDTIDNYPVISLNAHAKLGRRKLVIGRNLEEITVSLSDVTEISISPENKSILIEDGLLYTSHRRLLSEILSSAVNSRSIRIREGTKSTALNLFKKCANLRELHLPATLTDIPDSAGLKTSWDDPLVIYGFPESAALNLAQSIRCVYVDLSLPEIEQRLSVTFKMLPISYRIVGGGNTKYGYVTHGYTGTEKEIHIPEKIGSTDVTSIVLWHASNIPDTTYIPKSITSITDSLSMLARKQIIVDPANKRFRSAGGQLYDRDDRLIYCPAECDGTPVLHGVKILCRSSYYGQHRHEIILDKPLMDMGDIMKEGHLDRLIIKEQVYDAEIGPGTIDTVVLPECRAEVARYFSNAKFISIVSDTSPNAPEICRLAAPALRHAKNVFDDPARLLDGRSIDDYIEGRYKLNLPWLIRRHDEAFESIKSADVKIYMALVRLINPYLLEEQNAGLFRRYLQRSMKRCVELLCDTDDYELFRSLCKTGLVHKQNVKKLIEITTNRNKTEWTALLLQSAHV